MSAVKFIKRDTPLGIAVAAVRAGGVLWHSAFAVEYSDLALKIHLTGFPAAALRAAFPRHPAVNICDVGDYAIVDTAGTQTPSPPRTAGKAGKEISMSPESIEIARHAHNLLCAAHSALCFDAVIREPELSDIRDRVYAAAKAASDLFPQLTKPEEKP